MGIPRATDTLFRVTELCHKPTSHFIPSTPAEKALSMKKRHKGIDHRCICKIGKENCRCTGMNGMKAGARSRQNIHDWETVMGSGRMNIGFWE